MATINYGSTAFVAAAVREMWDNQLQKKIYARSISRNLAGAVRYIQNYSQGANKTLEWTRSSGVLDSGDAVWDIANADETLPNIDYGITTKTVTADMRGAYVKQKIDVMQDQEGFVVPDIMDSLAERMANIENKLFISTIDATTNVAVNGASGNGNVALTLPEAMKGVTEIKNSEGDCLYILMNPDTVQTLADDMIDASIIGDNEFLRNRAVGRLFGATVIETTYVADNTLYYLGNDAVRMYERMPYTMTNGVPSAIHVIEQFAIKGRFGFALDRDEFVVKSIFNGN